MTLPSLYKYFGVEGARLTLRNRTFKHAKPSDFNDTEDLTIQSVFPEALEPIREVWIHDEAFAASRLSMMRIVARRTNAAAVAA